MVWTDNMRLTPSLLNDLEERVNTLGYVILTIDKGFTPNDIYNYQANNKVCYLYYENLFYLITGTYFNTMNSVYELVLLLNNNLSYLSAYATNINSNFIIEHGQSPK